MGINSPLPSYGHERRFKATLYHPNSPAIEGQSLLTRLSPRQHVHERRLPGSGHAHQSREDARPERPAAALQDLQLLALVTFLRKALSQTKQENLGRL
jgi:hypothetical protein